jgi:hypothetical protein
LAFIWQLDASALQVFPFGVVPSDAELMISEFSERPLIELNNDSPVYDTVSKIMTQLNVSQ